MERELGAGGTAIVFLARDPRHERAVALKVLRPELTAALGAARFLREIQIAASLRHPHILPLYDSGEADGLLYYVMPYAEGESLRDRLERDGQLPVDDAVGIGRQVADALAHAHSRDIVHRDIKPENILLESGHAVVADFGIARAISAAGGQRLTGTGLAVGTPIYMSPEQATGTDLDPRADQYALATVVYEMLAGAPPFTGSSVEAVLTRRLTEPAPSVRGRRAAVPPAVAETLDRALSRAPGDRFPTVTEFAEALEGRRPAGATRRRHSRLATIGVVAALLLGAGAAVWTALLGPPAVPAARHQPGVVVLPFDNLGESAYEYFADGITEETTSRLAGISGLRVISRTTAMHYKGSANSLPEIGRELDVEYALAGTIRTDPAAGEGGEVRVSAQLIRTADDSHLWTDSYTADLTPGRLFAVQADIAERVAEALDVALLAPERAALAATPTTDRAAYQSYLLGRFQWNKRTAEAFPRAAEHFEAAIARDSAFAAAWAGLADTYALYPFYEIAGVDPAEAYARADRAARRAIALDPELAEAHASLAFTRMYGYRDWEGAERAFQRAIALDPDYPVARYWYYELLGTLGRWDDALLQARTAARLGPASPVAQQILALAYLKFGQADSAVALARRAAALEPDFFFPNDVLVEVALDRGNWAEAERLFARNPVVPPPLGKAIVAARRDSTRRLASARVIDSLRRAGSVFQHEVGVSDAYVLIGLPDSAIAAIWRGVRAGDGFIITVFWRRSLGRAADHPELPAIRRALGLPPYRAPPGD